MKDPLHGRKYKAGDFILKEGFRNDKSEPNIKRIEREVKKNKY